MYTLSLVLLFDDSELSLDSISLTDSVDSVSSDFLSESSVFSASGSTYVAYVPVVAVVPAALAASSKDDPPASASTLHLPVPLSVLTAHLYMSDTGN